MERPSSQLTPVRTNEVHETTARPGIFFRTQQGETISLSPELKERLLTASSSGASGASIGGLIVDAIPMLSHESAEITLHEAYDHATALYVFAHEVQRKSRVTQHPHHSLQGNLARAAGRIFQRMTARAIEKPEEHVFASIGKQEHFIGQSLTAIRNGGDLELYGACKKIIGSVHPDQVLKTLQPLKDVSSPDTLAERAVTLIALMKIFHGNQAASDIRTIAGSLILKASGFNRPHIPISAVIEAKRGARNTS